MAQQRKVGGRDEIAAAALALIDEQGLNALSMRKVGARLGVEAMTLYGYVRNRDDLLEAVHSLLLSKVQTPSSRDDARELAEETTTDWVTDALRFAWSLRETLMAHPNAVAVVATRAATQGPALDLLEAALQTVPINAAGDNAAGDNAAHIVQTLFVFVVGHCSFHAALNASHAPVSLDPKRHPRLTALEPWTAEQEFERGLDILAAGLRAAQS